MRPFGSLTEVMPQQTVTHPQTGLADGHVAAKGSVVQTVREVQTVRGVAGEQEPKLGPLQVRLAVLLIPRVRAQAR